MSKGDPCRDQSHRPEWRVTVRLGNYSAFNGGRFTPSEYSELVCTVDNRRWRTNAKYVSDTPNLDR